VTHRVVVTHWVVVTHRVVSHFGSVFTPSAIAMCTHRPQGVIIADIYMSSNIYYYYT